MVWREKKKALKLLLWRKSK
ncbi:unnamed protein product [Victoria cruziana]